MKKILTNLEEIIAAFFLAVVLSVVVVNVALRFLTTKSFAWLEEVSYFSFAWMIFMGASAGFKRNLHSAIDLLIRLFPPKLKAVVASFSTFCMLITCGIIMYLSYFFAIGSGAKKTPILRVPYFYIDISVTIGFAFMCVHCIVFIYNLFKHHDYFRERPLYKDIYKIDPPEELVQIGVKEVI